MTSPPAAPHDPHFAAALEIPPGAPRPWGFWASLAWTVLALVAFDRFYPFEHLLLDGTRAGRIISNSFALGALNTTLSFLVPLIVLAVAVKLARWPLREYFGWVRPRARHVVIGIALVLALQAATSGFVYLTGADLGPLVEQYRAEQAAGTSHWTAVLLSWPSFICAPIVEESIFRGFLWRGWARSPLGATGTWLLSTLWFAAWHIPKAMEMPSAAVGGMMLVSVLLLGLLLGWWRRRSGGTTATILAHAAYNLYPLLLPIVVGALLA